VKKGRSAMFAYQQRIVASSGNLVSLRSTPMIWLKIWFRDEPIPRNASGKFLKRELRKEITGE
jgi:acyl-CoA synthetase (AMP-forming)/AMP-acid ligase II